MQTIGVHVEQPVHEAYHLGPPPVLPGSFSQPLEDDDGCNSLPEMARVMKQGQAGCPPCASPQALEP